MVFFNKHHITLHFQSYKKTLPITIITTTTNTLSPNQAMPPSHPPTFPPSKGVYPKITITYCPLCKWLLRSAYYAQELLSTFASDIREVSLRPAVAEFEGSGVFWIDIEYLPLPLPLSLPTVATARTDLGNVDEVYDVQGGAAAAVAADAGLEGLAGVERVERVRVWDRKVEGGFPGLSLSLPFPFPCSF